MEIERRLGEPDRVRAAWQIERCLQLLTTDDSGEVTDSFFDDVIARIWKGIEEQQCGGNQNQRQQRVAAFLLEDALTRQLQSWDDEVGQIEQQKWSHLYNVMDERLAGLKRVQTSSSNVDHESCGSNGSATPADTKAARGSTKSGRNSGARVISRTSSSNKSSHSGAASSSTNAPPLSYGDDENYLLDVRDELIRRMEWENGIYGLVMRRAKNSFVTARKTIAARVPREPYEITVPDFRACLDLVLRGKRDIESKIENFRTRAEELHSQIFGFIVRRRIPDWVHVPTDREENWKDVWASTNALPVFADADEVPPRGRSLMDRVLEAMNRLDRLVQLSCDVRDDICKKCPSWEIDGAAVAAPLSTFIQDLSQLNERLLEILDLSEAADSAGPSPLDIPSTDLQSGAAGSSGTSSVVPLPPITAGNGPPLETVASFIDIEGWTQSQRTEPQRASTGEESKAEPAASTPAPEDMLSLRALRRKWNGDFSSCLANHVNSVRAVFEEHGQYFVKRRTYISLAKCKTVSDNLFRVELRI
ncbi:unnamed protein product [Amoebophrya sp. A25]|nr:unnamed protein product [Amoebophrya sp. A25]|eukprot:GSA25T00002364001.1